MHRISSSLWVIVVLLLFSGCRTYGEYGSEAATYTQIERTMDRFEGDLDRARGNLQALEAVSDRHSSIGVLTAQYARLVESHEVVLAEHRQTTAALSSESTYRSLHRAYGALVTEQKLLQQQYQGLLRYAYDAYAPDTSAASDHDRPYAVVPPYYNRSVEGDLTVNQVVNRVASSSGLREGFQLVAPPAAPSSGSLDAEASGGH